MTAKADLHVHTKHSNRPTEWVLKRFGAPESFTEPKALYRRCRERGMDFVTVSDHDSIDGALEIAHLPGTFLSAEVTAAFPEDGCEIHCLVLGIGEAQHREIQRRRGNVYELRDYLQAEDIVHSVAHPLFRVNDRLTLAHFEKLIVLFQRFEALNGIHDRSQNETVQAILSRLDRETLEDLAEKHRLRPWGERPWAKSFTGGSDDHGGFYLGTTYTETPRAATVEEFLGHLRAGTHEAGGVTGSSLRLTQSLYGIAYEYYQRRFPWAFGRRRDPFARLLRDLAQPAPRPSRRWFFRPAAPTPMIPVTSDLATFGCAGHATRQALYRFLVHFVRHARRGSLAESLGSLSQLAPLSLALAPYLVALQTQHKDRDLLQAAGRRFLGADAPGAQPDKIAWLLDTGAEGTVSPLAGLARRFAGRPVTAITCGNAPPPPALRSFAVRNFLPLAESAELGITLPPWLEILEHCERERYSRIWVDTPGPLGLLGLAAAKLLGLPLTGCYDAEFPLYLRHFAGSDALQTLSWSYLRWFYQRLDTLYVTDRRDRDALIAQGFDPARLMLLPPGMAPERPRPAAEPDWMDLEREEELLRTA
jgi:hypothetical protein